MAVYDSGDLARISVVFTVDGVETDPGGVTLTLTKPDKSTVTHNYGGGTVLKSSTGRYYADITLNMVKTWKYTWTGTAPAVGSESGYLVVRE